MSTEENKKDGPEHVKSVYQHVIDPGYQTGEAIFVLCQEPPSDKTNFAANEARRLKHELTPDQAKEDWKEAFKKLMDKLKIPAELSMEEQTAKKREQEPIIPLMLRNGKQKNMENGFTLCGDGDMDDSLADSMEIEGPISRSTRNYLRRMAKEMRETDVAINRAIENGNAEQAEFLSNQWDTQRGNLLIYLRRNKIRVCPMRKKDKEKIMGKAEVVEYKQEKNKGITHPKTRGHSRELTRMKEY